MTMHPAWNPKRDVARTYLSRKKGGRLISVVEDIVKLAIPGLKRYILTSEEELLTARRISGDYKQNLGIIENVKEFKEKKLAM